MAIGTGGAGVLKILDSQVGMLAVQGQASFVEGVRGRLRGRYPEKTGGMSDSELTGVIEQGMVASRGYGIESSYDVERFVGLMFELGVDFDRAVDWAREILSRPDFTGQIRIDVLCAVHEGRVPEEGAFFP